eukprot:TRINITY_DN42891_c0_g1_i1.p1 TRINITY_DN42891_c0_g1~~TRINITY_DN42891_c0_g1_i1.p1  ORF type:complete len:918 (+),score=321.35 TRINITY_DN42891_c0_g1_i1:69-2822(+)
MRRIAAAATLLLGVASGDPTPTPHGVSVKIGDATVELAVAGTTHFRVGVSYSGDTTAMPSPLLAPVSKYAPFTVTKPAGGVGIKTEFGEARVNTATGAFQLLDPSGAALIDSPVLATHQGSHHADTCAKTSAGHDVKYSKRTPGCPDGLANQTQASCCAACNADADCTSWVFATSDPFGGKNCFLLAQAAGDQPAANRVTGGTPQSSCAGAADGKDAVGGDRTTGCPDGRTESSQGSCCAACDADPECTFFVFATAAADGPNCWLLKNVHSTQSASNRVSGGLTSGPSAAVKINLDSHASSAEYYGTGYGGGDGSKVTAPSSGRQAIVSNTYFYLPQYWSTVGYQALLVGAEQYNPGAHNQYTVSWAETGGANTTWSVDGSRADLYLAVAPDLVGGQKALWQLTGAPPVPPRYSFGFLVSRWGWKNREYIWDMLSTFRNESFPIDAWISDFEWYTDLPDYKVPDQGEANYSDFNYNNVTFPDPITQLKQYHNDLKLRFGGIRKPRLGNTGLLNHARSQGWLISVGGGGAAGGNRNLNYSIADLRTWYQQQSRHYLEDGVNFWWNDEGESTFFTTHWWNQAEVDMLHDFDPARRFFTINRDFTTGMQRLGASVWTGDQAMSWDALAHHPRYQIAWQQAGAGYVTCDTGGFSGSGETPELLTRWYQVSAFMSHMRVHSTIDATPHFPWLWGDEAADAMRKTLNLRYSMIPTLYSLAHRQYTDLVPIFRSLMYHFGGDSKAAATTDQWLTGDSLMIAPILSKGGSRTVYFPKDADGSKWYRFNESAAPAAAGTTATLSSVPLASVPVYAKEGAVIPLAPVGVQYTDQFPGGPLEVQVYAGRDGEFVLVEDDGETKGYQKGASRSTKLTWSDASKTLSWTVAGTFSDEHTFTRVRARLFAADGSSSLSAETSIGASGKISF